MVAAAAVMVGCNKDAEEVVMVSADAPNVNGTWESVDNPEYKVVISGNKFTVTYPKYTSTYNKVTSSWDVDKEQKSSEQVFEGGKIVTDTDGSSITFVVDYTETLYADSKETSTTKSTMAAVTLDYTKVGDYLKITDNYEFRIPYVSETVEVAGSSDLEYEPAYTDPVTYYNEWNTPYFLVDGAYKKAE